MSKRTIYLLGILATLIIGFFLHWYFCCNDNCTKDTMTGETSQGNTLEHGQSKQEWPMKGNGKNY